MDSTGKVDSSHPTIAHQPHEQNRMSAAGGRLEAFRSLLEECNKKEKKDWWKFISTSKKQNQEYGKEVGYSKESLALIDAIYRHLEYRLFLTEQERDGHKQELEVCSGEKTRIQKAIQAYELQLYVDQTVQTLREAFDGLDMKQASPELSLKVARQFDKIEELQLEYQEEVQKIVEGKGKGKASGDWEDVRHKRFAELQQECKDLTQKLQDAEKNSQAQEKLQANGRGTLRSERDANAQELDAKTKKLAEKIKELRVAKDRLEQLETEKKNGGVELAKAQQQVAEKKAEADGHAQEVKTLTGSVKDMTSVIQKYKQIREQLNSKIKEQATTLETVQDEHSKEMQKQLRAAREESERESMELRQRLAAVEESERNIFEEIQSTKGNVRAICRVRPGPKEDARPKAPNDDQLLQWRMYKKAHKGEEHPDAKDYDARKKAFRTARFKISPIPEKHTTRIALENQHQGINQDPTKPKKIEYYDPYELENVFGPTDDNRAVFKEVKPLVQSALNGRTVSIFAYGQTGSGKTHTMSYPWNEGETSNNENMDFGIIPNAVRMIAKYVAKGRDQWSFRIEASYYEIYAEKRWDLFNKRRECAAEESPKRRSFMGAKGSFDVEGLREALQAGADQRRTSATEGNAHSSRSHAILQLKINAWKLDDKAQEGDEPTRKGYLNLIDLAGSETYAGTSESKDINVSLSWLNTMLQEMGEYGKSTSYKKCLLTRELYHWMRNDGLAMMFVMISPLHEHIASSRESLDRARIAMKAKLRSKKDELEKLRTDGSSGSTGTPAPARTPSAPPTPSSRGGPVTPSSRSRIPPPSGGLSSRASEAQNAINRSGGSIRDRTALFNQQPKR